MQDTSAGAPAPGDVSTRRGPRDKRLKSDMAFAAPSANRRPVRVTCPLRQACQVGTVSWCSTRTHICRLADPGDYLAPAALACQ